MAYALLAVGWDGASRGSVSTASDERLAWMRWRIEAVWLICGMLVLLNPGERLLQHDVARSGLDGEHGAREDWQQHLCVV